MLGNSHFYNESLKNLVAAFGTLFNDIQIERSGVRGQLLNVPLSYASKDKAYVRRKQDSDLNFNMRMQYPRMAFLMTGLNYDPSRKINLMQTISAGSNAKTFHPVPYNVEFELYIISANIEDGMQIVEQILPYFAPEYTLSIKQYPTLTLIKDVPIQLNSVMQEDNTIDSEFEEVRVIEWTLSFTAKSWIAGPINTASSVIKDVKIFTFESDIDAEVEESLINVAVNPLTASVSDEHTITTSIT